MVGKCDLWIGEKELKPGTRFSTKIPVITKNLFNISWNALFMLYTPIECQGTSQRLVPQ